MSGAGEEVAVARIRVADGDAAVRHAARGLGRPGRQP